MGEINQYIVRKIHEDVYGIRKCMGTWLNENTIWELKYGQ